MGYQSRKRNYRSRRERYNHHKQVAMVIIVFTLLGLAIYLFLRRHDWVPYLKTYFY